MLDADDALNKVANQGISLSIQRVLYGCIEEVGGPEKLGEIVGKLIIDDEASAQARIGAANNVMKLMAEFGEGNEEEEDEELIEAQLRSLQ